MDEEVVVMDNCLAFFDELYAQILSHPKSTVITHTYSIDRDVWVKTETNIIQYIEAWYRHIVKIRLIVEEEFVANENFMEDIRRIASNALCFSMENYRSIRLYDMLKENGYKVFGP